MSIIFLVFKTLIFDTRESEHRGRATSSASKAARAAELERCSRLDAQFNRLAALGLSMQLQKLVARLTGALVRDVLEHRKKAVHSQSKA
jgi:hypothetical protein